MNPKITINYGSHTVELEPTDLLFNFVTKDTTINGMAVSIPEISGCRLELVGSIDGVEATKQLQTLITKYVLDLNTQKNYYKDAGK